MTDTVIFPGQGSQSIGMLADLAASSDLVRATFDEASRAIGRDLWALVSQGPASELDQTRWTQPAMLAGDIAVWRVFLLRGGEIPQAMAGHSLGEYAALVAAESMALSDAAAVVHERGRLMQEAVGQDEGAMAAILGLEDAQVERICADLTCGKKTVVAANYNSPGQIVIAGSRIGVESAVEECRKAGAKRAILLPVSVPAHSPLMKPAADGLQRSLKMIEIKPPVCAVLHNFDLQSHEAPQRIRHALVEQLTHPVPWTATIRGLIARGATRFLECGPGRVLSGLGRRIDRNAEWLALETPAGIDKALEG